MTTPTSKQTDELPEVYEMRKALNALNLEVHHSIAKDVGDKVKAAIKAIIAAKRTELAANWPEKRYADENEGQLKPQWHNQGFNDALDVAWQAVEQTFKEGK